MRHNPGQERSKSREHRWRCNSDCGEFEVGLKAAGFKKRSAGL